MKKNRLVLTKREQEGLYWNYDFMTAKTKRRYDIILLAVSARKIKGKLGFDLNTPDADFLFKSKAIHTAIQLNTGGYFVPPFAGLADLDTKNDLFEQAIEDMEINVLGGEGAKATAKSNVKDVLDDALAYINKLARNNQANAVEIITGAKMEVIGAHSINKQNLEARQGTATGEIKLSTLAEKNADGKYISAIYYWNFSIDNGTTWEYIEETMEAKTTVTGMPVGLPVLFRKKTKTTHGGMSAWSASVEIIPQ